MKFKANFYAKDANDLADVLQKMLDQIGCGNSNGFIEHFPNYAGAWSIEPTEHERYSDAELDDLSTIPFGR